MVNLDPHPKKKYIEESTKKKFTNYTKESTKATIGDRTYVTCGIALYSLYTYI